MLAGSCALEGCAVFPVQKVAMPDDMRSRRRNAAQAFAARRGDLGLTQEEVAAKAGVALRTVQSLESTTKPTWPNPTTRARLERALGWPAGEIARLASPPKALVDPQLLDRLRELTADEREWSIQFLVGLRDVEAERHRCG